MKTTVAIFLAAIAAPYADSAIDPMLDPLDPVAASFLREFERSTATPGTPRVGAAPDHDRLPEIFRGALDAPAPTIAENR